MKGKEDNKTEEQTKIMENLKKEKYIELKSLNQNIMKLKYRRGEDYKTKVQKMRRLWNYSREDVKIRELKYIR